MAKRRTLPKTKPTAKRSSPSDEPTQEPEPLPELVPHADDPLLNLREVGELCGKDRSTVARWCNDGLLECIRLPSGLHAVRTSVVRAFLGGSCLNK